MFETIKRLFKEEKVEKVEKVEKDEEVEKEELDYEKYFNQKMPEYLMLQVCHVHSTHELIIDVYLKGDYIGQIHADSNKIDAHNLYEEKRVLGMIFSMIHYHEEELELQRLRKELAKEKLEFMRLRNEMLKKKLGERTDKDEEEKKQ